MKSNRIYHILIDRFFPVPLKSIEGTFNGGTIQGIIDKLDYIQGLNMTGIMITPFYSSAQNAYHGYHITDYETVDSHFGTWSDVKILIEEVHQRNMIIVADFVANHCHENNTLYKDGKHKNWFQYQNDGKVKGFSGLSFLPMFNTDNSEVKSYLTHKALHLCELGFDAIRLDHAAGPSYSFWAYFRDHIKSKYPHVQLIGEVWGKLDFCPRNIFRYWFHHIRYTAQEARQLEYCQVFDGLLDFSYQSLLCNAVHKGNHVSNNKKLLRAVNKHFKRYPQNFDLWLFLDNHDLDRFLFECGGNKMLLDESTDFSLHLNRTYVMYYGTELKFSNVKSIFDGTDYADERVRECMRWT